MIYKLRRKFILISTASVLSVVALVFFVILALNVSSMNGNMDMLADRISEGGGRFPGESDALPPVNDSGVKPNGENKALPKNEQSFGFITRETPFSTRHFTVLYDSEGELSQTFTESIYSIDAGTAVEYAEQALGGGERGWISNYRYKVFSAGDGVGVVFVDGSMSRSILLQSMTIAGLVLFACAALVLILILFLSKRAVKPIAESYEKQKQFITDANHELKTPLTLILANVDIAEEELGKNEWLSDIRAEGQRMTDLVNQLVSLSRMDEGGGKTEFTEVSFGEMVAETAAEFEPLARERGKTVNLSVDKNLTCLADEGQLCRLVGILMDNAVKYCDAGGEISVTLRRGRKTLLTVENTYSAVDELELDRLFDRFYRADKARKFTGGYGIGLSMAKAIAENHKGEIVAYKKDGSTVGFKVTF